MAEHGRARRRLLKLLAVSAVLLLAAVLAAPWALRQYWSAKSSNPVRRGVARAGELGCFSCHGPGGHEGIPDPGRPGEDVPAWSGGVWMMYVENAEDIRAYILDGHEPDHGEHAIVMPAYRDVLSGSDLEDLVAAFKVLSAMALPSAGTAERRGLEVARRWECLACHGVAGSGGLPNPGSFTGFIPGWYGADFEDLVRDRDEFDTWIREGSVPRLRDDALASYFLRRQRIDMPAYPQLSPQELDDLWAYAQWLARTEGGYHGVEPRW